MNIYLHTSLNVFVSVYMYECIHVTRMKLHKLFICLH